MCWDSRTAADKGDPGKNTHACADASAFYRGDRDCQEYDKLNEAEVPRVLGLLAGKVHVDKTGSGKPLFVSLNAPLAAAPQVRTDKVSGVKDVCGKPVTIAATDANGVEIDGAAPAVLAVTPHPSWAKIPVLQNAASVFTSWYGAADTTPTADTLWQAVQQRRAVDAAQKFSYMRQQMLTIGVRNVVPEAENCPPSVEEWRSLQQQWRASAPARTAQRRARESGGDDKHNKRRRR